MDNREKEVREDPQQWKVPKVFSPWRRFFARSFDMGLLNLIWMSLLAFVFQVNILGRRGLENFGDLLAVLILMLFLEPVALRYFKTTPGKKILSMRIEDHRGEPLSYKAGLWRTFGVIRKGMGFNIPLYNLFCLFRSYSMLEEMRTLPWDESTAYILKDRKKYRIPLYLLGVAATLLLFLMTAYSQRIPPNRGDLTPEAFVENHNYYVEYFDIDLGNRSLDSRGNWQEKDREQGTRMFGYPETPEYDFLLEDGVIKEVSFTVKISDVEGWINPYHPYKLPAALAFAGAREEAGLFSGKLDDIGEIVTQRGFEDEKVTLGDTTFRWEVRHSGFEEIGSSDYLYPKEPGEDNDFYLRFSMGRRE